MKRKRPNRKARNLAEIKENTRLRMEEAPSVRTRGRRRWMFRLVALCLPWVFLGILEAGLRFFGYGYPVGYFLKTRAAGRPVIIANQDFTRRFFPPGLARTPLPLVLPAEKSPDTVRIFILGESAAMGDPAPAYGFGRMLQVLLEARFPHRKFEVANLATTAINSHVIREIARDCLPRQGDVWILYMGNNEVVGPFGAGTVFSERTPGLAWIRAQLALKTTRLGQWLDALRTRWASDAKVPSTWEGMEMFLDRQVQLYDPALDRVYSHFERNLQEILEMGTRAGARILVSTVVCNLKDCAPFASIPTGQWTSDQKAAWDQLNEQGVQWQARGDFGQALAAYQSAEGLQHTSAELLFRMGQCYFALEDFVEAKRAFEKARDLDTLRFRIDTRLNQIIRQTAITQDSDQVSLVDAEEVFAAQYPHRITGEEFLYEHVHLNFAGNYLLARSMAETLSPWLEALETTPERVAPGWLSSADCAARLALTVWDRVEILEEMSKRLDLPPFIHQLTHAEQAQHLRQELASWQVQLTEGPLQEAVETYRRALAKAPEDWMLHERFATLLQNLNLLEEARQEWQWVLDHVPGHVEARYHMGNTLDKLGRSKEATAFFLEALRARPELYEARNGLALALASQGQTNEAILLLEDTLRRKPDFAEARVNLGQLLARQGQITQAQAQYETAIQYQSNNPAAHINLGQLLARQGQNGPAESHYRMAISQAPNNAIAHFNLGNLLAERNDPEAVTHYQTAVQLNPNFVEARINYGLALASQGRGAEALAQLQEVVRLQPGSASAHLNLGVALARQQRLEDAVGQFQETLRLDPGNVTAQEFLEQARKLLGQKRSP